MMTKILAALVAFGIAGTLYLYFNKNELPPITPTPEVSNNIPLDNNEPSQNKDIDDSLISNYEECLAAGYKPMVDAPDKCLTKSGHVFIEGVQ